MGPGSRARGLLKFSKRKMCGSFGGCYIFILFWIPRRPPPWLACHTKGKDRAKNHNSQAKTAVGPTKQQTPGEKVRSIRKAGWNKYHQLVFGDRKCLEKVCPVPHAYTAFEKRAPRGASSVYIVRQRRVSLFTPPKQTGKRGYGRK